MSQQDFKVTIDRWLQEVCDLCHGFATDNISLKKPAMDFNVFQSDIYYKPKLLVMSTNPHGCKTYEMALNEKGGIKKKIEMHLHYDCNQYIHNPVFKNIAKPLCYKDGIFSDPALLEILDKSSAVMNAFYFNTPGEDGINTEIFPRLEHIKKEIRKKNEEVIDIIQPENILFLGKFAPNSFGINFNRPTNQLCKTKDGKETLIWGKRINSIPHFMMYHTTRINQKWYTGDNLLRKREYFEGYFKEGRHTLINS